MFDLLSNKDKKRARLAANKDRGRYAEKWFEVTAMARGTKVVRKPHGQDYIEYDTDILGNTRGKGRRIEIKTGNARLSKLQRKTRAKNKKDYRIVRSDGFL